MIQVTLSFSSVAAALAVIGAIPESALAGVHAKVSSTPELASGNGVPPAPSPTPAPKPSPAATPAASAPAALPASSTTSSASPASPATGGTTTGEPLQYERDVKPIVIKVGAAGKRDALVQLLQKFGVAKGPEVPADKLPAFKAELEALVA